MCLKDPTPDPYLFVEQRDYVSWRKWDPDLCAEGSDGPTRGSEWTSRTISRPYMEVVHSK